MVKNYQSRNNENVAEAL